MIRAPAERIYANRHVFRLELPVNPALNWVLKWIPRPLQISLQRILPEWFLPPTIILKEKNPGKTDEYTNEIQTYKRLELLQGQCIPRFFGEAISENQNPGLILQYIEGIPLHKLPFEDLVSSRVLTAIRQESLLREISPHDRSNPELLSELRVMYDSLTENGVVHGDAKLHNFIRVVLPDGMNAVVAVDFEFSELLPADITNEMEMQTLIDEIDEIVDTKVPSDEAEMLHIPPTVSLLEL